MGLELQKLCRAVTADQPQQFRLHEDLQLLQRAKETKREAAGWVIG